MATTAGHRHRFFFTGRMALEIDDARMTTDAANIAVNGLRECDAEGVSVMACLTLTDGDGRLGDGCIDQCKRAPYDAKKTYKRDDRCRFHVVSQSHDPPASSVLFLDRCLFLAGWQLLPSFHAAE